MIINSAELEKYFGKDKSPREMKDKIISLLDDWKAKQPPELGKPLRNVLHLKAVFVRRKKVAVHGRLTKNTLGHGGLHGVKVENGI